MVLSHGSLFGNWNRLKERKCCNLVLEDRGNVAYRRSLFRSLEEGFTDLSTFCFAADVWRRMSAERKDSMTTKEQAKSILDMLAGIPEVRSRPMMGEYVVYYRDKVVGGIYDGELLLKAIDEAAELLGNPASRVPYEHAKSMLVVNNLEDTPLIHRAFEAIWQKTAFPKNEKMRRFYLSGFFSRATRFSLALSQIRVSQSSALSSPI